MPDDAGAPGSFRKTLRTVKKMRAGLSRRVATTGISQLEKRSIATSSRVKAPRPAPGGAYQPKRGRPTAAQVEAINRAILATAAEYFLAVGFEAASMEGLAARAGVSKGTLYARYPTKGALAHAVIEERVAAWSAESSRHNHLLPTDFEARLRYHAKNILRAFAQDDIRAFRNLLNGSGVPSELGREFHEVGQGFAIRMLADEIASCTRNDPVPARHPERIARMLVAMLYGWFNLEENLGPVSAEKANDFADQAVDVLMAGRAAW